MKCIKCKHYVKTIRKYLTALTDIEIEEHRKSMHSQKHDYPNIIRNNLNKIERMTKGE